MIKSELVQKIADKNPHLYHRDVERIVNRILDEVTGKWIWRFPMPGALFRLLGTVGDWIKHVYDFSFPLSRDAMEFATRWPGTSAERTTRELGITFRDAHATYADTLRWLYEAGYLTARHVGKLAR